VKVKKLIFSFVMSAAFLFFGINCFSQVATQQDVEQGNSEDLGLPNESTVMDFNYATLVGKVLDENKKPVANLRLEVELASDRELQNEISTGLSITDIIKGLKQVMGSGVFTSAVTNETGEYRIKGIAAPGIYYVHERNAANYFPTSIKVSLDASQKKDFNVPDLNVKTRETPVKVISEKALTQMDKARNAIKQKDFKTAIKCIEKAIEIEPEYGEGYYRLAILNMNNKDTDAAMKNLEKAVQFDKENKMAFKTLGDVALFKKDYQKALNSFSEYLALREKEGNLTIAEAKIYFQAGNCCKALKKFDDSFTYFEKYLDVKKKITALDQKDSLILNDIGAFYYGKKNMDKAIDFYLRTIELNPAISAETYMYLGNSYFTKRDGVNAIKYYSKYLEMDPKGKYAAQVKALLDKLKTMYPNSK